jgi:exopolyphosphatase/guanosine-5'-triphosphate,3'-diphosphate pyrophosphatase
MESKRFCAIDVGSNAMRCHVVEVASDGTVNTLASIREPVRLGTNVFLSGRIGEATAARTLDAFHLFKRLMESHGVRHVRAVATSAMREAADAAEIIARIEEETGIRVTLIDGAEEAHLVRRAVADRLDLSTGRTAAVDVGGGSVEVLVIRDGDVVRTESFTIGAVRLLEALQGSEQGDADFFSLLNDYVGAVRSRVQTAIGPASAELVAATGGSVEKLADLAGREAKGARVLGEGVREILLSDLKKWIKKLARLSFRERVETLGLREDRADVILPAAVVYLRITEMFRVDRLHVPGVGLKDGLVLDMMEELELRGAAEGRSREVRAAVLGLGKRFALDEAHAAQVAKLALSLLDQTNDLHGFDEEDRTLLEAAAILHDVGLYISASKHHKHSYYLVSESDLVGLDRRRREIVANVVRYHRKRHPTIKHALFAALSEEDQEKVRRLAAILRVADVLDREHRQHVKSVRFVRSGKTARLHVAADGDLLLEKWASMRKFKLFGEVFGLELELVNPEKTNP